MPLMQRLGSLSQMSLPILCSFSRLGSKSPTTIEQDATVTTSNISAKNFFIILS